MILHCDTVFKKYISCNYPDGYFKDKKVITKPDLIQCIKPNFNIQEITNLDEDLCEKVIAQIERMKDSAISDWNKILGKDHNNFQMIISEIDEYYDAKTVQGLIKKDKAGARDGEIFISAIQMGSVLGYYLQELDGNWKWLPDWPYWESPLYHKPTGHIANVFHWAVKKFSSYGLDDGLVAKAEMCNSVVNGQSG